MTQGSVDRNMTSFSDLDWSAVVPKLRETTAGGVPVTLFQPFPEAVWSEATGAFDPSKDFWQEVYVYGIIGAVVLGALVLNMKVDPIGRGPAVLVARLVLLIAICVMIVVAVPEVNPTSALIARAEWPFRVIVFVGVVVVASALLGALEWSLRTIARRSP